MAPVAVDHLNVTLVPGSLVLGVGLLIYAAVCAEASDAVAMTATASARRILVANLRILEIPFYFVPESYTDDNASVPRTRKRRKLKPVNNLTGDLPENKLRVVRFASPASPYYPAT